MQEAARKLPPQTIAGPCPCPWPCIRSFHSPQGSEWAVLSSLDSQPAQGLCRGTRATLRAREEKGYPRAWGGHQNREEDIESKGECGGQDPVQSLGQTEIGGRDNGHRALWVVWGL